MSKDHSKGTSPHIVLNVTQQQPPSIVYRLEIICSVCGRNTDDGHDHGPGQMQALVRHIPITIRSTFA